VIEASTSHESIAIVGMAYRFPGTKRGKSMITVGQ